MTKPRHETKRLIVFTHIPKTSGTSFFRSLVTPNCPEGTVFECAGIRSFCTGLKDQFTFVTGHNPHGLHRFTKRPVQYVSFFRDPIDRAVSHYYFIKDSNPAAYKHPDREFADSKTLLEFYRDRRFRNLQTRYIAGYEYHRSYPLMRHSSLERQILKRAIDNLESHYHCFGLLERFDESLERFQCHLGWNKRERVERQKKTGSRPTLAEIDSRTRDELRDLNALDVELYEHAVRLWTEEYSRTAPLSLRLSTSDLCETSPRDTVAESPAPRR